jgi:hypothetical protein
VLIPDDDILHPYTVASDASPSAARSGSVFTILSVEALIRFTPEISLQIRLTNPTGNFEEFFIYKII